MIDLCIDNMMMIIDHIVLIIKKKESTIKYLHPMKYLLIRHPSF